ncbi:MAG: hypothetical protein ACR2QM_08570 [Longimicrobiales bacterium]
MKRIALIVTLAVALSLIAASCSDPLPNGPLPQGIWGGEGVRMEITSAGATLEFDCASGTIDEPVAVTDGRIDVDGTFTLGQGGPVLEDEVPDTRTARYLGTARGNTLTLEVRFEGLGGAAPPTYVLTRGDEGLLRRCL